MPGYARLCASADWDVSPLPLMMPASERGGDFEKATDLGLLPLGGIGERLKDVLSLG